MFGRKFRVPLDLLYGKLTQNKDFMSSTQVTEKLELMYEIARRKMNTRQDTYATYYDEKVLDDPLRAGDLVYAYLPRNKNVKLAKKWKGSTQTQHTNSCLRTNQYITSK